MTCIKKCTLYSIFKCLRHAQEMYPVENDFRLSPCIDSLHISKIEMNFSFKIKGMLWVLVGITAPMSVHNMVNLWRN